MSDITDAILEELKNAFPAKRRRFMPLGSGTRGGEADYVEQFFADKDDWTKIEPDLIDRSHLNLRAALCFMCDEAIRFYIPVYMAADLTGKPTQEDPRWTLRRGFDEPWSRRRDSPEQKEENADRSRALWADLSRDQVSAIVHYLEWRVASEGAFLGKGILKALRAYWYERLSEADISASASRT